VTSEFSLRFPLPAYLFDRALTMIQHAVVTQDRTALNRNLCHSI
jgi:hypothetical protein